MFQNILAHYGISSTAVIKPYGSGLINSTWLVSDVSGNNILQRVNEKVFKDPQLIADNIEAISLCLRQRHPDFFFVAPVKTISGKLVLHTIDGWFRLFPFVAGSHTYNAVDTPGHAFEAARQFGQFTSMLSGFPVSSLQTTLHDFHNLTLRYNQFKEACIKGNQARIVEAAQEITFLESQNNLVSVFQKITASKAFKLRVTHHDTKISNVLFNEDGKGICIIDLDTVMPGYFISDVGDMMRTYLSPVSEEEKDFSKIMVREDFFRAILKGYLNEMKSALTAEEIGSFVYSGLFMIYMQALRFLTDYLNNDIYYGAAYDGHNYMRAKNQVVLLQKLLQARKQFEDIVLAFVKEIAD